LATAAHLEPRERLNALDEALKFSWALIDPQSAPPMTDENKPRGPFDPSGQP
jgi:hypothetical protein